jgi:hypothetical protein
VESSGEQQHLNGAAIHGQRPGVIYITLHYITYSTQQGVGTPLGANERLIGGAFYAFSVNAALTKQNCNNLPATAWINKLKVRNASPSLSLYFC